MDSFWADAPEFQRNNSSVIGEPRGVSQPVIRLGQASILFARIEIQATSVRLFLACSKQITQVSSSVVLFLHVSIIHFI